MGKVNIRGAQLLLGMPRSIVKSFVSVKKMIWTFHFNLNEAIV